ncbi:hypothetical protein [uncultured Clostridium sp.]|uniref:hypothetical protein n=1 Tax=uncultured Clostridium sp. TaxID=59620 RepID=UPI0025F4C6A8|nr:hypothetical protein [uncultured Clostridium sp.]
MRNASNLIKCPTTGDILIYSDLLKGIRTIVTDEQLRNHPMHPQSGLIKDMNGNLISIVDLLLEGGKQKLVEIEIENETLNLTTDKFQKVIMEDFTDIVLPDTENFVEIHLFFNASEEMTLILPDIRWQDEPVFEGGKYYELVFTFTGEWLGGVVVYE